MKAYCSQSRPSLYGQFKTQLHHLFKAFSSFVKRGLFLSSLILTAKVITIFLCVFIITIICQKDSGHNIVTTIIIVVTI